MSEGRIITPGLGRRPILFQQGDFLLHSGQRSWLKIEMDALTNFDWMTLARMVKEVVPAFGWVEGVPRGGLKLARMLNHPAEGALDRSAPLLIVDDVFTSGASMEAHRAGRDALGCVVFARAPVPAWITPLFVMSPLRPTEKGEL